MPRLFQSYRIAWSKLETRQIVKYCSKFSRYFEGDWLVKHSSPVQSMTLLKSFPMKRPIEQTECYIWKSFVKSRQPKVIQCFFAQPYEVGSTYPTYIARMVNLVEDCLINSAFLTPGATSVEIPATAAAVALTPSAFASAMDNNGCIENKRKADPDANDDLVNKMERSIGLFWQVFVYLMLHYFDLT